MTTGTRPTLEEQLQETLDGMREADSAPSAPAADQPELPLDSAAEKQAYADLIAFMKQHADPGTDIQHLSVDEFMDGLE